MIKRGLQDETVIQTLTLAKTNFSNHPQVLFNLGLLLSS